MGWFKHAFAVDDPDDIDPTPQQKPVVDWICREVARRHLTTPGLLFLGFSRPLNYIGSMGMRVLQPFVWTLFSTQRHENYVHFAKFLEKRGSMEYLCQRVEHYEEEFTKMKMERDAKAGARKRSRKHKDHRDDRPAERNVQNEQGDAEKDQPHE